MANTSTAYPLVNGVRHSWASCEIRVDGFIILGITELNYKSKLDPSLVYGAGPRPIAFTLGRAEFDGDFTILLEEFNALVTVLGDAWKTKQFDIVVSYDESGSGLSTIVDTIQACRITDTEAAATSANADAIVRKLPFKCLGILYNGVDSVPAQKTETSP